MIAVIISSGLLYFIFNFDLFKAAPKQSVCPIRMISGYHCPGCGMTKAMLLIGQLKLKKALVSNIFSIPLLIIVFTFLFKKEPPAIFSNKKLVWIGLFLVLAYWILRNIFKI